MNVRSNNTQLTRSRLSSSSQLQRSLHCFQSRFKKSTFTSLRTGCHSSNDFGRPSFTMIKFELGRGCFSLDGVISDVTGGGGVLLYSEVSELDLENPAERCESNPGEGWKMIEDTPWPGGTKKP